jgi:hypothetical protein
MRVLTDMGYLKASATKSTTCPRSAANPKIREPTFTRHVLKKKLHAAMILARARLEDRIPDKRQGD